jgi:hypothetical protein
METLPLAHADLCCGTSQILQHFWGRRLEDTAWHCWQGHDQVRAWGSRFEHELACVVGPRLLHESRRRMPAVRLGWEGSPGSLASPRITCRTVLAYLSSTIQSMWMNFLFAGSAWYPDDGDGNPKGLVSRDHRRNFPIPHAWRGQRLVKIKPIVETRTAPFPRAGSPVEQWQLLVEKQAPAVDRLVGKRKYSPR